MISEKLLAYLHNDIQLYDKKKGNDYLIAFGKGKKDQLKYCQITFHHYNFWHLIGCEAISENHLTTYLACKNGEDVSKEISLVHSYAETEVKHSAFVKVFDFIANAKLIKLGNDNGFVGYDYPKNENKKFLIPKSVQDKKVSMVSKGLNKILFILSKPQSQKAYNNIEYEIKKGIVNEYISQIPQDIDVSGI